ncbi:Cell envelope-associated transcriptional attenuator LytR-CpsA-Psr, subfamily F2 [Pediococcus damnosus]|uniref:Cell envelope-associated transcriptional attenuator LytR-CpsA-Psr, subfamily F2 n=1 Tax=Pediococcus damnosus TaxID=51663 RepID=A0A0R2HKZ6_9LACO|nr:LCP family protein [Pediococcus damnosus]AMV62378.1 Cell envelope-associated transcriptional attenuator LytR-CpsA-Psr, subfamily F2 [Pediococcus damnosus]AMV67762.1 Cell envelope-associated transcriptional attenuator LytR-CpsA-Psr, subfamily F2 [Pediococcus damnosus]AMV68605.1 Cell envelope-associated transcriptional attenuator LytR-CpsA-Psr, subfamily F2 [Pediococcus damnosus]KJU73440.1 LytR family transcriptional regulator [Pediococcus damnosus LMG 28219]KRN50122.1 transcriptional regulat
MRHEHESKQKNHTVRNVILTVILILLVSVGAYAARKYYNIKHAVDNTYQSAGIKKDRNASSEIQSKRPISILLMGTDTGALGRSYKGRTDTMMLITMNPKTDKTTITSIPRDTGVTIPGYESESPSKINAAYSFGSSGTAIKTVQEMLNVPIDFYAVMNMGGMEKVVNAVGGVTMTPTLSFKYDGYTFTKGESTHMNGKKALAYSRMRYDDPNGDYGRQTRQREVIMAIMGKAGSISSLLNKNFLDSISAQMKTDLTFSDLTAIAQNYRGARKTVSQTHLQGTGGTVNGQSMELMAKSELQRVTNLNRKNLGLDHATTGNIALGTSATSSSSNSSVQNANVNAGN